MSRALSDEEIAGLAQIERDMDSGKQAFVECPPGKRWAFPPVVLGPFGIVSGQRVNEAILMRLLESNVAHLATIVAVKKARDGN